MARLAGDLEGDTVGGGVLELEGGSGQVVEVLVEELYKTGQDPGQRPNGLHKNRNPDGNIKSRELAILSSSRPPDTPRGSTCEVELELSLGGWTRGKRIRRWPAWRCRRRRGQT